MVLGTVVLKTSNECVDTQMQQLAIQNSTMRLYSSLTNNELLSNLLSRLYWQLKLFVFFAPRANGLKCLKMIII